ncbi:putative bifunctional diguanylate cyclase/phosphodiesterase [Actinoplanes sp. RD1]|uniref:putative bifunctional diguanylate cyclase/phosphodiesterase n=1 Tax=Actinoplanes sp. RD1 TaxID=3064538 RepID=UPI0027416536|nr:bifunctional diguanylate cyclase/phosphodiesterase [Actinoplanes sp. RD1]
MLTRMIAWRDWLPTGGGLRDEDWARRHRLLTQLLAACVAGLTGFGVFQDGLDRSWLVTTLLILPCVVLAVTLKQRRLSSTFVAIGFTVACGGFVSMAHGLTEAHFTFFIAVAALALYRDWTPFGVFLIGTTLHHAVLGTLDSDRTYDHHSATTHPWLWAVLHGGAVLLAAAFQVVQWQMTETEEKRAQENLDDSQAQLSLAFDETPVPSAVFAPDGRLIRCNRAYRQWLRLPLRLPAGFGLADLPLTALDDANIPFLEQLAARREPISTTRRFRRTDDNTVLWVETHGSGLYDREGRLRQIFVHCLDVTQTREQEAELQRQVRHDALTGLLSRSGFEADFATLLMNRMGQVSVLYLDVDRFKSINDGIGHAAGDEVLRALGGRLAGCVPPEALVSRLSGDEFVVAVPGPVAAARRVAHALTLSLAEPVSAGGSQQLRLTVSIGLAVANGPEQAEDAILCADTAMYAAKRAGGNRVAVFSEDMRVDVRERLIAEARLREALDGDLDTTLPVWFQPIVSAEGRITGAEALVRMRTPEGHILAPGQFVGVAEETGLVIPLGEHVLNSALRHLLLWDGLGYVSVNVSPRQLAEPGFVPMLADLLSRAPGLDPSRLVLEITETAVLADSGDLSARLHAIKDLGVRIALDDFGTGYSSLTWLQSVPADVLKLDRSFVEGLSTDTRKASIVSAVLWLAGSLGMSVVAEGVEDAGDWYALRAAGCPAGQGYLFSRPVPGADFDALLRRGLELMPA